MKQAVVYLFILAVALSACGKKETVRPNSDSGLDPKNFVSITSNGDTTDLYIMKNAKGMEICVTNIGARIVSILVPDKNGEMKNVVLGFDHLEPYLQLGNYYGATIGRYANRIADGHFMLHRVNYKLRANDGKNILHGGPRGFHTQYFDIEQLSGTQLRCHYFSKDGEEGFPGNLHLYVTYTLTEDDALDIAYEATTDRGTIINPTNHSYFNLSGAGTESLEDHEVYIDAANYTPVGEGLIPTGKIEKVTKTPLDYTNLRPLDVSQFYDINYVLNKPDITNISAKVISATTGISMTVFTTEPGMQFYVDRRNHALCLETQHFPDSPNQPNFPSTVLLVDSVFTSRTIYQFAVEK
jgi:Galactose mutarotase and related enzymes